MSARGLPWRIVAVVFVIVAVVGAVLWFRPWETGGEVRFDYRAMFAYLGSEDNEPLENLALRFPAPQIENNFTGEIYSSWELYYIEDDNSLTLQATTAGVINLRGSRSSQLEIYTYGIENSTYGPALLREMYKLYPREVFVDLGQVQTSKNIADSITLQVYGVQEDWSFGYWHTQKAEQENKHIDFSFAAGLYQENILIEQYEVTWENESWGGFYLAKTT